jgi:hypothetical protein
MKNPACFLLLVILFASCAKNEKKADVLSQTKMRDVMWDMIRADQYVADLLSKDSTKNKKDESIKLYEEVFHVHKTTREEFKKSLDYYSSRPDLFRPIIDSLAKRRNDFIRPNTHPMADSLIKQRMRKRERKQ